MQAINTKINGQKPYLSLEALMTYLVMTKEFLEKLILNALCFVILNAHFKHGGS